MSAEHSELSARVLSYLKRKSGKGIKPTDAETSVAEAALALISVAFPAKANDPEAMFKKLIELSRTRSSNNSSLSETTEARALYLQRHMDNQAKMLQMMSTVLKAQNDTARSIIANIK